MKTLEKALEDLGDEMGWSIPAKFLRAIQKANRILMKIAVTLLLSTGILFMSLLIALVELREVSMSKEVRSACIRGFIFILAAAGIYAVVRITGRAYFANMNGIW